MNTLKNGCRQTEESRFSHRKDKV